MKRFQSNFTALIMLLVAVVILLGVLTIIGYQNQVEMQRLRAELAKRLPQAPAAAPAPTPIAPDLSARIAALEKRMGMNDPEVDKLKESLTKEQAEAKILAERAAKLTEAPPARTARPPLEEPPAAPPVASAEPPPAGDPTAEGIAALPVVATIGKYDRVWFSGQIDKGSRDGIQLKQHYAVRRPGTGEIVAMVNVTDCGADVSAVELIRGSLVDEKNHPREGDQLVDPKQLVSPAKAP